MRSFPRWALTPLALLTLAACSGADDKRDAGTTAEPSSKTVAALIDDGDFGSLDRVVENAGLTTVLEGTGPYTVLAPADPAFAAQSGVNFTDPAMKAQGAALLRAHILPGALTRQDIGAAIDRSTDKRVQMRTMADGLVTFTREGEAIVVTAADGAKARLTGDEALGQNGVVQPIDALLIPAAATGTDGNGGG